MKRRVQEAAVLGCSNPRAADAPGRVYTVGPDKLERFLQGGATMFEATTPQSTARLRNMFAILLITCGLSNLEQLWKSYQESLTKDILI